MASTSDLTPGEGLKINDKEQFSVEFIKSYSLEKALEAYKYNQQIPLLELADKIEQYLISGSGSN